tara:strand:+ start:662 stop:880 length:219 start_codon:yes stop_codon:yes gene_type:complete
MVTSIQVSEKLAKELQKRKMYSQESYETIIWDLLEDSKELSKETKKEIAETRAEIKAGKFYTLDQIKEELGI